MALREFEDILTYIDSFPTLGFWVRIVGDRPQRSERSTRDLKQGKDLSAYAVICSVVGILLRITTVFCALFFGVPGKWILSIVSNNSGPRRFPHCRLQTIVRCPNRGLRAIGDLNLSIGLRMIRVLRREVLEMAL